MNWLWCRERAATLDSLASGAVLPTSWLKERSLRKGGTEASVEHGEGGGGEATPATRHAQVRQGAEFGEGGGDLAAELVALQVEVAQVGEAADFGG